jgi:hypothetical protein
MPQGLLQELINPRRKLRSSENKTGQIAALLRAANK